MQGWLRLMRQAGCGACGITRFAPTGVIAAGRSAGRFREDSNAVNKHGWRGGEIPTTLFGCKLTGCLVIACRC